MAVPVFTDFYLPFLQVLNERGATPLAQMHDALAQRMNISEEGQREMLPSGRQRRYYNRVGWARTYLSKAGLIHIPSRGVYELTDAGRELLLTNPAVVDRDTLRQYDSFRTWERESRASPDNGITAEPGEPGTAETPVELINENFRVLRQELTAELAEALQGVSWQRFEDIVIDVLLAMGYGGSRGDAGHAFRSSGDGGVDGVINEDRLGLSKIYVQAKRYAADRRIGRPDVQAFVGSLLGQKARQGVFITTSSFSAEANDYVRNLSDLRVILISGETLAQYMIDHDVGVSEQERFILKRLDRDYFEEE